MTEDKKSIAAIIAEKISDLAQSSNRNHILDEINIYGVSDKDGSVVMSFDWNGSIDQKPASDVLEFFNDIKNMLPTCGCKTHEQIVPTLSEICGNKRINYRFKASPFKGKVVQHGL